MAPRASAPALAGALLFLLLALPSAGHPGHGGFALTDDNLFNNRFEPAELTAEPREPLPLKNTGTDRHTLTSVDGAWPEIDLAPQQTAVLTAPAAPGEYRFYCRYHASPQATPGQGMAGVLRVQEGLDGAAPPPRTPLPWALVPLALAFRPSRCAGGERAHNNGFKGSFPRWPERLLP